MKKIKLQKLVDKISGKKSGSVDKIGNYRITSPALKSKIFYNYIFRNCHVPFTCSDNNIFHSDKLAKDIAKSSKKSDDPPKTLSSKCVLLMIRNPQPQAPLQFL